jgi:AbrB family looped-hinge helix DNA binding protein
VRYVVKFEEARLTSKGQITIPKSVRLQLGLKTGKSVLFIPEGREVIMIPKVKDSLKDLERIRDELEEEGKLITEKEFRQIIKESKKEWSKIE